jgi:16S rRNA (guanine966-N2)-methyltransferase
MIELQTALSHFWRVMRIISGKNKRKQISAPPGLNTRPTSDRIRENIFNIISTELVGANVLDLFAGSGALGLESLSRGAAFCHFIEKDPTTVGYLRDNIKLCGHNSEEFVVINGTAESFLSKKSAGLKADMNWAKLEESIDFVFADPPYTTLWYDEALLSLEGSGMCRQGCLVILEMGNDRIISEFPHPNWEREDTRVYGKSKIEFWRKKSNPEV